MTTKQKLVTQAITICNESLEYWEHRRPQIIKILKHLQKHGELPQDPATTDKKYETIRKKLAKFNDNVREVYPSSRLPEQGLQRDFELLHQAVLNMLVIFNHQALKNHMENALPATVKRIQELKHLFEQIKKNKNYS